MLFIELLFNDTKFNSNTVFSDDTSTTSAIKIKANSYYDINVFWFGNYTAHNFTSGLFYAVGQTKQINSTYHYSDFVVCKLYDNFKRCDDYFLEGIPTTSINRSIFIEFNPKLDSSSSGGKDDIFNYVAKDVVVDYLGSFTLGLDYKITKKLYATDSYDLDFDITNNLTFVYGSLGIDNDKYFFENPNFRAFSVETINMTTIFTTVNSTETTNSRYLFLIGVKLLSILLLIL